MISKRMIVEINKKQTPVNIAVTKFSSYSIRHKKNLDYYNAQAYYEDGESVFRQGGIVSHHQFSGISTSEDNAIRKLLKFIKKMDRLGWIKEKS